MLKYLPNEALSNCKVSENMSLQNRKRQREKEKKNPRKEGRKKCQVRRSLGRTPVGVKEHHAPKSALGIR